MIDAMIETPDVAMLCQKALAQWDNEGGAGPDGPQRHDISFTVIDSMLPPIDAELVRLRIRVIALENF